MASDETAAAAPSRFRYVLVGVAAVVIALVFHPEVLGMGGTWKLPSYDAMRVFWPDMVFMHDAVRAGELPLWNPYDRGGYAFAAEPQSRMFDPIRWMMVLWALAIGGAPSWLMAVEQLVHYVVGAVGVVAFVDHEARRRGIRLPAWAVAPGVLIYVAGGRMDKLKDQSGLWPSAWAPWLLLALSWSVRRPSWRRGVALGLAGGLAINAGYPPIPVRLAALMLLPLGGFWAVQAWREVDGAEARRRHLGQLGVMVAVAAAVCAALTAGQVLATSQVLGMAKRGDMGLAHVLASQVQPEHALGLLAPGSTKVSLLLYGGVASGLGVLAAVVARADAQRWVLAAIGVVGFLLACGDNFPLLPLLAELPGFRSFRIAGHFAVLSALAAAVLVPEGLAALSRPDRHVKTVAAALGVLGAAVFLRFAAAPSTAAKVAVVLACVTFALLPQLQAPREGDETVPRSARALLAARPWMVACAGWLLVLATAVDLWHGNRPVAALLRPPPDELRPALMVASMDAPNEHRMFDYAWAENRPGTRAAVRDLYGAKPALTDRHFMTVFEQSRRSVGMMRAMGVELAAFGRRVPVRRFTRPRHPEVVSGAARGLRTVPDPWPRVFWVKGARIVADEAAAVEVLRPRDVRPSAVAFGVDATALEDHALGGEPPGAGSTDQVETERPPTPTPNPTLEVVELHRLEVNVEQVAAAREGLVVLNEAWDPGWRAEIDGLPAPIHRVNLIHRAVVVPAGAQRLVLRYEPPGVRALWWLWLVTMLGAGGVVIWSPEERTT